jgi:hypothetical protein
MWWATPIRFDFNKRGLSAAENHMLSNTSTSSCRWQITPSVPELPRKDVSVEVGFFVPRKAEPTMRAALSVQAHGSEECDAACRTTLQLRRRVKRCSFF